MPIASDWTINYAQRRIYHSSGTTVYSMNELYSWLMNVFDESGTIDDTIPMTAQTPTAYTLTNGWFLDYVNNVSHQFLNGGSLKTIGWDALTYSYGIRKKAYNASGAGTAFGSGDIGKTLTETDTGDTGIILAYDESLGTEIGYVWIRPDALTDTFQDPNSAYTVATSSAAGVFSAASTTGETIWANPFTLGTLASNTKLYVYQNDTEITPWWASGHLDIFVLVKETGQLIDRGIVTFFARQYTKLYDHYLANLSGGSQTPIPMATFTDSNNTTGYRQMVLADASANFTIGEVIQDNTDSTIHGIVTGSTGPVPDITLSYYLFKPSDPDFANGTGLFTGQTSGSTATAVDPTNIGPASYSGITFTFGTTSQNLNNGNGLRPYDAIINVNNYSLANLYQYLKYLTCYGSTISLNGHLGEDYVSAGDIRLPYDGQTGDFTQGLTITGATSGATGIIVSDHENGAAGALVLRDVSGTFTNNEQITDTSTGDANIDLSLVLDEISPVKQSPFGTFAGGKFFGARGVWLTGYLTSDANNYELIDSTGVRQVPPTLITLTISGLEAGDRVSVFRTTGDNETVNRGVFTSHAANNIAGLTTFEVDALTPIPTDTPNSGIIRIVDNSLNRETRYTYTSWSGLIFSGLSPALATTYEATDTAYVPYIDLQASGTSVSTSVIYDEDRYVLTVVRMAGIQPFKVKGTLTVNGLAVTAIRNPDTIYQ